MIAETDRPHVLLVDDDVIVRDHIARALSDEFVVDVADDGGEALKHVLKRKPDVIATDVVMPSLDGIELLKMLRSAPSTRLIPVLLISGRAADDSRVEGFEHGADEFLSKPYTERELRARLRSMVRFGRDRAEASRKEALEHAERNALSERAVLLESITDPFYALDERFRFTYINQRAADYFKRSADSMLGRIIWEVFPQSRGSRFERDYRRSLQDGQPLSFEDLSPISGRWVDVHLYPTPSGLAINFRDITERKEFERTLHESEASRLAAARRDAVRVQLADTLRILHSADDIESAAMRILGEHLSAVRAMWVIISPDTEHATVRANYLAQEIEPVIGQHRLDDFGIRVMGAVRAGKTLVVENVAEDARLEKTEKLNTLALGVQAHVLAPVVQGDRIVAAVAVHHSKPTRWSSEDVLFIQEFAERTFSVLERMRAETKIREANRRKDEFLATLAHELRNPLAPMRNAAHLLNNTVLTGEQSTQTRRMIERQINHMIRLVDDLLDVTRISMGQINLRQEVSSVNTLIQDAVEAARPAIEEGQHTLNVMLSPIPLLLEGDATRLVQVIQNLLNNAAKYTPAGGRIEVSVDRINSEVAISVRDNGMGIELDAQQRIFELFTRVHPEGSIKVSGLGIGLSLARQLVELHNGRLEVHSEGAQRGSEFTVYLPLLDSQPQATTRAAETAPLPERRRILVVDDNRDAADSLALLLEIEGFETIAAYGGRDALREYACRAPDLVLLDIGMPDLDGYQVARQIRAGGRGSDVLLVALTGWGQPSDKRMAFEAGFDEHITKPIDPNSVARVLELAYQNRTRAQRTG